MGAVAATAREHRRRRLSIGGRRRTTTMTTPTTSRSPGDASVWGLADDGYVDGQARIGIRDQIQISDERLLTMILLLACLHACTVDIYYIIYIQVEA